MAKSSHSGVLKYVLLDKRSVLLLPNIPLLCNLSYCLQPAHHRHVSTYSQQFSQWGSGPLDFFRTGWNSVIMSAGFGSGNTISRKSSVAHSCSTFKWVFLYGLSLFPLIKYFKFYLRFTAKQNCIGPTGAFNAGRSTHWLSPVAVLVWRSDFISAASSKCALTFLICLSNAACMISDPDYVCYLSINWNLT